MPKNGRLSSDARKLRRFICEKAPLCVHEPQGILQYRFVTPSYAVTPGKDDNAHVPERSRCGHYLQMYDWDACFFSETESYFGLEGLASDIVSNFLRLNQGDGYIPRTISPNRIWDGKDLCKPFLAQALLKEAMGRSEVRASHQLLADLDCYLQYIVRNRQHASGLYHWRNVLESGVDNSLALLAPITAAKDENDCGCTYPDGTILAVDLNSYLVAEFRAFAKLTRLMGYEDMGKPYLGLADKLVHLIDQLLWNEQLSIYCNLDPFTSQQIGIRTWTGLLPAILGFSQSDRIEQVVQQSIMNERLFLRPWGLSTVAASEQLYNQAARGLYGRAIVSNWQGPVWVLPNAIAVRGLLTLGYKKQAEQIAERCLSVLVRALNDTGTLYENYDAETGRPLWAPQFISWNALVMEFFDLLK